MILFVLGEGFQVKFLICIYKCILCKKGVLLFLLKNKELEKHAAAKITTHFVSCWNGSWNNVVDYSVDQRLKHTDLEYHVNKLTKKRLVILDRKLTWKSHMDNIKRKWCERIAEKEVKGLRLQTLHRFIIVNRKQTWIN